MRINKAEYDHIVASMQHDAKPRQFHSASAPEGLTVLLHAGELYVASPIIDVGYGSQQWLHVSRSSLADGPATVANALQSPSNSAYPKAAANVYSAHTLPTTFWEQTSNTGPSEPSTMSAFGSSQVEYVKIPTPVVLHNSQPTPLSTPAPQVLFPSQIRTLNPKDLAAYSSRWTPYVKTRQVKALERLQKARAKNELSGGGPEDLHHATSQKGSRLSATDKRQGAKDRRHWVDSSGNKVEPGTANAQLASTYNSRTLVDPLTGRPATTNTPNPITSIKYRESRLVDRMTGEDVEPGTKDGITYKKFIRERPVDRATGLEVPFGTKGAIARKEYERLKRLAAKKP